MSLLLRGLSWFRGTSVRFVFWLLRSEFSLALAYHESWTTSGRRNVLSLRKGKKRVV